MTTDIRITSDGIELTKPIRINVVRSGPFWGFECSAPGCGETDIGYKTNKAVTQGYKKHLKESHPTE